MNSVKKYSIYVLLLPALIYVLIESDFKNDFTIFLSAAGDLLTGENIYAKHYIDGYHYYYSAFFCLLLKPFTYLPFKLSIFIWLSLNLFFLYRIWKIISDFLGFQLLSEKQYMLISILSFLFILQLALVNFHLAQLTVFMVYLMLEGVFQIAKENPKKGAFFLALGMNIKILPVVLIPYLIWRKEWKAFSVCILFYLVLLLFPALFIGRERTFFLIHEWWALVNPFSSGHVIDRDELNSFYSLSSTVQTLMIPSFKESETGVVLILVRLGLIFFSLYFLGIRPFRASESKPSAFRELSYIILLIPLIFPHQKDYGFFCVLPAAVYIFYFLVTRHLNLSKIKLVLICTSMVLSYLCFNLPLLLGMFDVYYEHFKIITWGTLLMIVPLVLCKPVNN